jgi:stress response protein YsnF
MAQTVVGLFENYDDAQEVVQALINAGCRREDIQMKSGDETRSMNYESRTTDYNDSRTRGDEGGGMMDKIGNFFSSMFGDDVDEREAGYYSEAVTRGNVMVLVDVSDSGRVDRVVEVMEDHDAIDIDERAREYGSDSSFATGSSERDELKVPIVEEELQVGKRPVRRGGVRVYTRKTEVPVEENVTLREERVRVDRHPADRPASAADMDAFTEGEIEISETAEEPIVRKQARVVEEVVIGKDVEEHTETIRDTVQRTDVDVEDKVSKKTTNRR